MNHPRSDSAKRPPPTRGESLAIAGSLWLATGVSATALVGQSLALPGFKLASTDGWMAPSAALSVLILGGAFAVLQWRRERRVEGLVARAAVGMVAAASVILGVRNWAALRTGWDPEQGLTSDAARAIGLRVMHLSPTTAAVILLTAGVVGVLARASDRHPRWRAGGWMTAVGLFLFCGINALGRIADLTLFEVSGMPIALTTALALALFNLALALAGGLWPWIYRAFLGEELSAAVVLPLVEQRKRRLLITGILGFSLLLAAGCLALLHTLMQRERREVAANLTNVVDLKLARITAWRQERIGDTRALQRTPFLAETIAAVAANEAPPATRDALALYLEEFRRAYGYQAVQLFDRDLKLQMAATVGPESGRELPAPLRAGLLASDEVLVEDLYFGPQGAIWIDFAVALRRGMGGPIAGAVLLRLDARQRLYPLVNEWPATSASAEFLLFRREDRSLLYLNELRFRSDSALKLRLPLGKPHLLASRVVLEGNFNLSEGLDYRDVPVLGLGRRVPDSPWLAVVKVDVAEAYGPVRTDAWSVGASFVVILAGAGLLLGGFWRRRQRDYEHERWEAEQERREAVARLGLVMRHANDAIFVFDQDMRIIEANERALEIYGYPLPEILRLTARDLRSAATAPEAAATFSKALTSGGVVFETRHRRKDGTEFPVEVSSRPVTLEGRQRVLSLIRDITERHAHQEEIERLNRMYFVISQVNQVLVRARDRAELFAEVCRTLVEIGRFKIAWVGWLDAETRRIDPVAVAGDEHGYVAGIAISADPSRPEGRGPSGAALREGHTYVCNDFFGDPVTAPWRERAARSGFRSSIALPLRQGGKVVGLLTVYAEEREYFTPRKVTLLEETAGDVSFALEIFEKDLRRRQAEAALAANQDRLKFLLSATPAVIFSLRADGDYGTTFVSENVATVLGYRPQDFTETPDFWIERIHPDDRAGVMAQATELVVGRPLIREYRFRHRDGGYRWMHDELQLMPAHGDRSAEIVGFWIDITGRRTAEQAVRDREELFAAIFDQAVDSIVLYDPADASFRHFNEAAHRNLGYTREEFARLTIRDIDVGLTPAQIASALERFSAPGGGVVETRHRCKDGSIRDVRLSARRVVVGGREFLGTVWSDITEQRRMVDALRASEERHRTLFENMDLGVVYQDATGAIMAANPAATHILGLTLAQMQGRTSLDPGWRALREDGSDFAGEDHPAMVALRTGARVNGVVMGVRVAARREMRWLLIDAVPEMLAGESRPHRVFTIFADITARREAEAELRKLSRAVEQSPNSVVITDLSGKIEYVNPRFVEVTGYAASEVLGQNPRLLKSGGTAAAVFTGLWQTISRGEVWRGEIVNRKKSGELFVELVVITPVKDADGDPTHYVALKEDITERKRMEAAARESERRYRLIADNTGDIIWLYHLKLDRFEYISPSVQRLRGYTPEEAMAVRFGESLSPESAARVALELPARLAALAGDALETRTWTDELEFRRKDGSYFPAEVTTTVMTDAAGRPERLIGVTHDISERKRAEVALRASEARLRQLLEKVPLPLAHVDRDGRVAFRNERWMQTFGYSPEEVPDVAAWWQRAYPDASYRQTVFARWEAAVRAAEATGGEIAPAEYTVTCRHGEVRIVEISAIKLGEEMLTTFLDLTARRQAEGEVRKLSRTIEQAPLSVVITDLTGAIEYVNPQFCQVTGYTLDEVRGKNPRVLKSGDTPPAMYREMWDILVRGQVWRGELHNRKKNGESYVEAAVIAPVVDDLGRATHYVALKEDITARKRTEAVLQETQSRYRLIAENTSDVIWLYDLTVDRFVYCSPSVSKLRGCTAEEVQAQCLADGLTAESTAVVAQTLPARIGRFAQGDRSVQSQVERWDQVRRDGSVVPTEVVTTLLPDPTGAVTQILGVSRDITERERAEEDLRQSRDRLARAEQIARLGNWQLDLATQELTWSDEMFRLLELDPRTTQPSLETWHGLMDPVDREKLNQVFAEALRDRRRFVLQNRLHVSGGRFKYVEGTGEIVCAPDGTPVRAIGTVQDVTEHKLMEIELHELVKGLRALHQIAKALERRDLTHEELATIVVRDLPPAMSFPEDIQASVEIDGYRQVGGAEGAVLAQISVPITVNDRAAGHVSVGYVRPHAPASDGPFFARERDVLENIARTIGLGLGEREAFAAVQRFNAELEDKVARRTVELAARNEEVQALLESIPDMVLHLRRDGTVLKCQPAKEATLLANLRCPEGETEIVALPDGLRTAVLRAGSEALEVRGTVATEVSVVLGAEPMSVELRCAPIGSAEFVVFLRDITARKRLEAETAAMLEKERQVSEMKSRFISVTSHEFRTPIAAAMGTVELLHNHLDRISEPKREEMFARITSSLRRMTEMLEDLLLLNRMDAGRTQVQVAPIHLAMFAQSVVDEVRLGDRTAHHFLFSCEGDAASVATDAQLLHHILSNLLSNAARYSPAGSTVTTTLRVDAGRVRLEVEDQGIGVPETERAKIFEAFERGSNVGTIKGTGLGLNIVKRMTQMLGGKVWVESPVGPGSRFIVELPR